ncbi:MULTISPECIES: UDP-N-acetylglucosamine 1-carboxyvinyltransferase [unclassified Streptomyces]|uniref:UDP-N-acetylglucosamine 1-carboxyvinyltransferase n=1 Tax=unclassified Streptomyces TaxID=2593676 RepID=UPI00190C41BD|nr:MULTISPECIES: UDP-N-acetylglucosamine 1-carboxyvinyltransferase [unclassified Streptomyces]MBK3564796.1 UDP-N-acetylglucosamine 1-carboxyvinyltransferase [Streptomyces sp. MBT62]MBK6014094.1 UDP-N-acetylglucosamine 1-carboxyvinyltransferase [Streptomyces sp. MBT53]
MIAVRPGPPLGGTVTVDGSKNAALPLLATAAALGRPVRLTNVPANTDVQIMLALLHQAGWHVAQPVGEPTSAVILPTESRRTHAELPQAAHIRASYYLVPALLARHGEARLPWPGGCRIGARGMELHFTAYEAFGDHTAVDDSGYRVEAVTSRTGTVSLVLPFRSRGATVAAVLRAVTTSRPLRLGEPNLSPEVLCVLDALETVGWETRTSEHLLTLTPPSSALIDGIAWEVPGDKIEAGTLACAIAATRGTAHIEGVHGRDVNPLIAALRRLGIPAGADAGILSVRARDARPTSRGLRAIASLSPGGLDADFEPPLMALALSLPGTHLFADAINPGRHSNLLPQLARLGADFEELSPTECRLTGPQELTGTGVEATDIRTGSALMVAGLTAQGVTTVGGLDQLRRGHADLPGKLRALGADICEVTP